MLLARVSRWHMRSTAVRTSSSLFKLGPESDFTPNALKTIPVDKDRSIVAAKINGTIHAVSGKCTHWGAPMGQGYLDGYEVLCPWHIAPFDIRTGRSLQGPGVAPLLSFPTSVKAGEVWADIGTAQPQTTVEVTDQRKIVIIGGGAAGQACAETLRSAGFRGTVTLLSQEAFLPVDKPVLSKSILGDPSTFQLRPQSFYDQQKIDVKLSHKVARVHAQTSAVVCENGATYHFDKLLIATGAGARVPKPYQDALAIKGVFTLRDPADSAPLQASLKTAKNVVVIGGSFLGMEFATSVRKTLPNVKITVLDIEDLPLSRALGSDISAQMLQCVLCRLQRNGGVNVLTGAAAKTINQKDGKVESVTVAVKGAEQTVLADTVLLATGAQIRTNIVPKDLLESDGSIKVNTFLQSSNPNIYAAGDIATYFDVYSEAYTRIEHWVVAQNMGRLAALNMLGIGHPYAYVPFFWTNMFGNVQFVGNSQGSDSYFSEKSSDTDLTKKAQATFFFKGERTVAVCLINRYGAAPRVRFAFERGLMPTKTALVGGAVNLDSIIRRVHETAGGCCRQGCGK